MKQLRDEDKIITQVKHIHMIGIGGSGMCPLAEILHGKGYFIIRLMLLQVRLMEAHMFL